MVVPPPPPVDVTKLPYGTSLRAGRGVSTVLAEIDFETYSEAGYRWCEDDSRWRPLYGSLKGGLSLVGLEAYASHPSTEVLCLAYDLKNGAGPKLWSPGLPPPQDLFDHISSGKLIEAWNSAFEERIWHYVCVKKYGWPDLLRRYRPLRCAMAKARAYCLPGALADAGRALRLTELKLDSGKASLNHFSKPRNPTKKSSELRNHPLDDLTKLAALYEYCRQDIRAEAHVSALTPDLIPFELLYWQMDQDCNERGVRVDVEALDAVLGRLDVLYQEVEQQLTELTDGQITSPSEVQKMLSWLAERGCYPPSLDEKTVSGLLDEPGRWPEDVTTLLELRQKYSLSSVKKYYTIRNQIANDRLHNMFMYHAARTGRDAGSGFQPQNLPNSGPPVKKCTMCEGYAGVSHTSCPRCLGALEPGLLEWGPDQAELAFSDIKSGRVSKIYDNEIEIYSACIRGVLIADPGHDFIGSDYSSIEAVVAAVLSGEQWRIEAFRNGQDIYLLSASKITGVPYEEYLSYRAREGQHHIDRKKYGKIAELASGFAGWVGAWKQFGADSFFSGEHEIKQHILAWRSASPAIVDAWGGQTRGKPWEEGAEEYYGLEGKAIEAILDPGNAKLWRCGVYYLFQGGNLYCYLPSGRAITYHSARLVPNKRWPHLRSIVFTGHNTNPKMGSVGWVPLETYGGRLFENCVQAVARDIMANAAVNLHSSGYPIALRVHDELVSHVECGFGSIEQFEAIGNTLPCWADGWPVKMSGGWRAKRFRK